MKVFFCFLWLAMQFSSCLSPLTPIHCWPCSLPLTNKFCGVLNFLLYFRYTTFMWRVAALRELTAHAQREIAELRDVSLGSANKIVRLEDTCWVSSYNIGRYVLSRENHVSPLKRSGNYTYRQVWHMKHRRSPDSACVCVCVCPMWYLPIRHLSTYWSSECMHPTFPVGNKLNLYIFRGMHCKIHPNKGSFGLPQIYSSVFLRCPPQSSEVGVPAASHLPCPAWLHCVCHPDDHPASVALWLVCRPIVPGSLSRCCVASCSTRVAVTLTGGRHGLPDAAKRAEWSWLSGLVAILCGSHCCLLRKMSRVIAFSVVVPVTGWRHGTKGLGLATLL